MCPDSHVPGGPCHADAWRGTARYGPPGSAAPKAEYAVTRTRASGGIGRRAGFRFLCPKGCGGSSPPSPTQKWTGGHRWRGARRAGGGSDEPGGDPDAEGAGGALSAPALLEEPQPADEFCADRAIPLARASELRTVPAVPGSLTARKQADLLRARLRGLPEHAGIPERAVGVPTLAKVLPHRSPLPALPCEPILVRIDDKGRVKARGALEAVGLRPGLLQASRDVRDPRARCRTCVGALPGQRSVGEAAPLA